MPSANTQEAVAPNDAATLKPDRPVASLRPRRVNRRALARVGLLVAVIAIGATLAWRWWSEARFIEATDDAYVGGDVTQIATRVPGTLSRVYVRDNQAVHAGELLASIDDRDYRAALAKAESGVAAQQALIGNLGATRTLQDAVIAQARAGISAARAETLRAGEDQSRYRNLASKAAVSVQSKEKAEAEYVAAVANDDRAEATATAAERELDVIAARRQQAQAALAQALAEREIARLNLQYTEVRAPIDGVVGNRRARLGGYVQAGSQLLSLVPSQGLWIDANFKESQLARLRPGQRVTAEADVLPDRQFHGTVASLAPATGAQFSVLPAENATGNFTKIVQRVPVRILLDGADGALGALRPGLSVVVKVDLRDRVAGRS